MDAADAHHHEHFALQDQRVAMRAGPRHNGLERLDLVRRNGLQAAAEKVEVVPVLVDLDPLPFAISRRRRAFTMRKLYL